MSYANELISFQVYMEAARAYPDCEELTEDFARARRAMEVAWLERLTIGTDKPASEAEDGHGRNADGSTFDPEVGWTTSYGW